MNSTVAQRISTLLALVAVTLLAGCGSGHSPGAGAVAEQPVHARTVIVQPSTQPVQAESPGTVIAASSAEIASRLTGYIDHVAVDLGDRVKRGQVLLTIDDQGVEAKVGQARANIASAKATLDDARSNYQRYRVLFHQNAVSRQTYERVKRNYETAQAQLKAAEANLKVAQDARPYAQVRAPMSGVITARKVDPGDLAAPGKPLLLLQESGGEQVETNVPPRTYRALALNDQVEVVGGGKRVTARVIHLGPAASPSTETHPVKLALPPNSGLSTGTFVRVLVTVGHRRALIIPRSAVIHRLGIPAVFIVGPKGRAHLRLVRLGQRYGKNVEVTAGLSAGKRLIVSPGSDIVNGTPVAAAGSGQ